jgi:ABC-type glutathione transport system ATPase component
MRSRAADRRRADHVAGRHDAGRIIELVRTLQRDFGTAVVWISHDLGGIGQVADDVTVLRDGEIAEPAPILDVWSRPRDHAPLPDPASGREKVMP